MTTEIFLWIGLIILALYCIANHYDLWHKIDYNDRQTRKLEEKTHEANVDLADYIRLLMNQSFPCEYRVSGNYGDYCTYKNSAVCNKTCLKNECFHCTVRSGEKKYNWSETELAALITAYALIRKEKTA